LSSPVPQPGRVEGCSGGVGGVGSEGGVGGTGTGTGTGAGGWETTGGPGVVDPGAGIAGCGAPTAGVEAPTGAVGVAGTTARVGGSGDGDAAGGDGGAGETVGGGEGGDEGGDGDGDGEGDGEGDEVGGLGLEDGGVVGDACGTAVGFVDLVAEGRARVAGGATSATAGRRGLVRVRRPVTSATRAIAASREPAGSRRAATSRRPKPMPRKRGSRGAISMPTIFVGCRICRLPGSSGRSPGVVTPNQRCVVSATAAARDATNTANRNGRIPTGWISRRTAPRARCLHPSRASTTRR
jgi:hypothetical protein